jgi:iron complex outermembrane recepter protein
VLAWQLNGDNMIYASAAKGYRVGGVNTGVGNICGADLQTLGLSQAPDKYASDNLWSYEAGGKNTFLDHRLQINSSLFWIDWRNIQQNVYLPSCGEQFTANLGHVVSRGGDVDIQFKPVSSVFLQLTAAYTDAKFTRDSRAAENTTPIVSAGDRLPGAPWSFTLAVEKTFVAGSDYVPYVRADFQYTTAQTALLAGTDPRNALIDTTIPGLPSTKDLQLRGGFRWNGYDISLFAQNVLDQHPTLFESRDIANATDPLYFGRGVRPRTYGLTATYRY